MSTATLAPSPQVLYLISVWTEYARKHIRRNVEKQCEECKRDMRGMVTRRFCSGACRIRHHRKVKRAKEGRN